MQQHYDVWTGQEYTRAIAVPGSTRKVPGLKPWRDLPQII
jgi:hypothetical protein